VKTGIENNALKTSIQGIENYALKALKPLKPFKFQQITYEKRVLN
jgi:hypothetical protein